MDVVKDLLSLVCVYFILCVIFVICVPYLLVCTAAIWLFDIFDTKVEDE